MFTYPSPRMPSSGELYYLTRRRFQYHRSVSIEDADSQCATGANKSIQGD